MKLAEALIRLISEMGQKKGVFDKLYDKEVENYQKNIFLLAFSTSIQTCNHWKRELNTSTRKLYLANIDKSNKIYTSDPTRIYNMLLRIFDPYYKVLPTLKQGYFEDEGYVTVDNLDEKKIEKICMIVAKHIVHNGPYQYITLEELGLEGYNHAALIKADKKRNKKG